MADLFVSERTCQNYNQYQSSPFVTMAEPHLLRLPVELHLGIIDKLEIQVAINLAFTNHYFRVIARPSHAEYLAAETDSWAKNRGLFTCSGCACFRRFKEFADDMKKGKYTRGGVDAVKRLCLKCGVTRGLYTQGMAVVIYGKPHVLCRLCQTFTDCASCQAVCTICSPGSPWHSIPSSTAVDNHHVRDHIPTRSARVYFDRTSVDELYGVWHDV
jgi:hypothetical protein